MKYETQSDTFSVSFRESDKLTYDPKNVGKSFDTARNDYLSLMKITPNYMFSKNRQKHNDRKLIFSGYLEGTPKHLHDRSKQDE